MELILAILFGVVCGAIPAVMGAIMDELEIGMIGFVASTVSALFFGLYGAVPVGILFAFYILRHARTKRFTRNRMAEVIPFPIEKARRATSLS
ncbi:hypothetical protein V7166_16810 [Bacillus thuringiensis]